MTTTFAFLVRLLKMHKIGMRPREVVILYTIIANPGISGIDIARKLGIPERSHIQHALGILEKHGLVEDRRPEKDRRKANPAKFHPLPAGETLWNDLKM